MNQDHNNSGVLSKILLFFIDSPLTPLFILASLLLGTLAIMLLPREEEPQIVVPMIDIFVGMPGSSAKEVEQRVTLPLEKLVSELPGVEYVYSTSSTNQSMTIARFLVGWDEEKAIVQLYQKLYANLDRIPSGATQPILKPRRIDDVPILALTFHGGGRDSYTLRRIVSRVEDAIKQVADVSETTVTGGQRRQVRVELDAGLLNSYNIDPSRVLQTLRAANQQAPAGSFSAGDREVLVDTGGFLSNKTEVESVVVGVSQGQLVYLRDIGKVYDGPDEVVDYVLFGHGTEHNKGAAQEVEQAVTIAVAKRKETNAVLVVEEVMAKVKLLYGNVIPDDVEVTITRDYGHTASEKSNELLYHMAIAVVGVSLLIAFILGWREAGVVAVAIPVTLALTLATFYLFGFTLNRVTLFALIFSIGILVDDPIVDVENVVRHFRLPQNKGRSLRDITVEAINEIRGPLILATMTVIAAVLPLAFVAGLMGPYMRPIPIGSTAAMMFSMLVSITVTPWAARRALHHHVGHDGAGHDTEGWTTKLYRQFMNPLIRNPSLGGAFLVATTLMLFAAMYLVVNGSVKVKMLPYDNKSELQVIIDMDEGTTLERTTSVALELAKVLSQEPEVLNYQVYAGNSAPYNFNGLVRHYFLRRASNVADIQVNLVNKEERSQQSHDIAKRIRNRIAPIAQRLGANIKVAEIPPGPPVLQTIVAEIYGPNYEEQISIAKRIRGILEETPGLVDVDWYVESDHPRLVFKFDQEKAAMHRIGAEQVAGVVRIAQQGEQAGLLHVPDESEDVAIKVRLPIAQRSQPNKLLSIPVCAGEHCVPLGEITRIVHEVADKSIYHKNMLPVVYVTGEVAGVEESPVYVIFKLNEAIGKYIPDGRSAPLEIWNTSQPFSTQIPSLKWDGEWHITYEVFRDLGLAFAVVLVLIYILVVGWFGTFNVPLVIMCAIPFSLVGILPAHWAMGAFFTATSMIGFIAGAGIVVRNSIILVDFIQLRVEEGMPLEDAVVDAGAVRFRPMMLTAMAVVVGGVVILFDPIFQGLAVALISGEIASLFLSRMAVPVIYYFSARHDHDKLKGDGGDGGHSGGTGGSDPTSSNAGGAQVQIVHKVPYTPLWLKVWSGVMSFIINIVMVIITIWRWIQFIISLFKSAPKPQPRPSSASSGSSTPMVPTPPVTPPSSPIPLSGEGSNSATPPQGIQGAGNAATMASTSTISSPGDGCQGGGVNSTTTLSSQEEGGQGSGVNSTTTLSSQEEGGQKGGVNYTNSTAILTEVMQNISSTARASAMNAAHQLSGVLVPRSVEATGAGSNICIIDEYSADDVFNPASQATNLGEEGIISEVQRKTNNRGQRGIRLRDI